MKFYEKLSPFIENFLIDMADIATEIKKAREAKELTQQQVADSLGIGLRNYQHIEAGRFPKYKTTTIKDLEKTLGIAIYDKIYVPRETKKSSRDNGNGNFVAEENFAEKTYIQKRRESKAISSPHMVPLVPVSAQAGYARAYGNIDAVSDIEMYPILPGIDPRGAIWRYFQVAGESMEPSLYEKDVVLVSMVPPAFWDHLNPRGQVHVIVTESDVLIKQVYRVGDDLILKSSNKKHKDKKIALNEVKELWLYKCHISQRIHLPKN